MKKGSVLQGEKKLGAVVQRATEKGGGTKEKSGDRRPEGAQYERLGSKKKKKNGKNELANHQGRMSVRSPLCRERYEGGGSIPEKRPSFKKLRKRMACAESGELKRQARERASQKKLAGGIWAGGKKQRATGEPVQPMRISTFTGRQEACTIIKKLRSTAKGAAVETRSNSDEKLPEGKDRKT